MAEDRQLLPLGPYHGVPHQVGVVHVAAVIGEGHRPRLFQRLCVGGLLPSQPHGHRRDGVDVDAAPLLGPLPHIVQLLRAVQHRVRVGHTGQGGDPSPGRRSRAGADVLFIGVPRVPQVYVHVHQARAHHQPRGVDDPVRLRLQTPLQQGHPAVFRQQVGQRHGLAHRVQDPSVLNQ